MRATALVLFWALGAIPGSAEPAEPQARYELKAGRQPSAEDLQVLELLNRSAAARDQGRMPEAATLADQALVLANKTGMHDVQAAALLHLATLSQHRGELEPAVRLLRQSQLLCEVEGNLVCQANARMVLAEVYAATGQVQESQRQNDISRRMAQAARDPRGLLNADIRALLSSPGGAERGSQAETVLVQAKARGSAGDEALALRQLGRTAMASGDLATAQSRLEQSLVLARSTHELVSEAESLVALGELAVARRAFPDALRMFQEAVAVAMRAGQPAALGNALVRRSSVELQLGEALQARDTASQALASFEAAGQLRGQGLAREARGNAEWALVRRDEAGKQFREAVRLAVAAGDGDNEAGGRLRLASLLRGTEPVAAMAEADRAMALYEKSGSRSGIAAALLEQAWIHGTANQLDVLVDKAQRSRALYEELRSSERTARVDHTLAVAFTMQQKLPQAEAAAGQAVAAYRRLGMTKEEADALLVQADVFGRQGNLGASDAALARADLLARPRPAQRADILVARSKVRDAQGDTASARRLADEALVAAQASGKPAQIEAARRQKAAINGGER